MNVEDTGATFVVAVFFNFTYQLFQCAYPVQYVVPAAPIKQNSKAATAKPVEKEVSPRNRGGGARKGVEGLRLCHNVIYLIPPLGSVVLR